MDNFEKVEKIREKTGVTYQEAKEALEACDYDMLDAMIYLEQKGRIEKPNVDSYSTDSKMPANAAEFEKAQQSYEDSCKKHTFGDVMGRIFEWFKRMVKKGCDTTFSVDRNGENVCKVPVIVLVIALIFLFPVTVILLIVGMFMDCRYSFLGFETTTVDINDMFNKASDACTNLKNDINEKE
ncbi:MAG: DUF4342 domain-containing protein [Clostridium sp.]|nr:DUF4342 domain-containing protein [Clostridium sp.]